MKIPREQVVKIRLAVDEKSKILSLAESLVKKEDIISLCAYGSRVAGYAREDSDYDVIVVTRNPKDVKRIEGVTEAHEKESKSPLIIVDETT